MCSDPAINSIRSLPWSIKAKNVNQFYRRKSSRGATNVKIALIELVNVFVSSIKQHLNYYRYESLLYRVFGLL